MNNNIRERREKLGLKLEALARQVKISKSYLSQIETGTRGKKMNYPLLIRIARALDTTPDYLMNGDANGEEMECTSSRGRN